MLEETILNTEQKPALKPWESRRISKEQYKEYVAKNKARQINAPEVGQPAPDFEINTSTLTANLQVNHCVYRLYVVNR